MRQNLENNLFLIFIACIDVYASIIQFNHEEGNSVVAKHLFNVHLTLCT